jgi:isopentenyl-diphosphate delta-isomerase
VKRAAQRKLEHELGIPHDTIALDEFVFLTRIHYVASSDPVWGEHESAFVVMMIHLLIHCQASRKLQFL